LQTKDYIQSSINIIFYCCCIRVIFAGDIAPVTEIETIWENIVVMIGACFFAAIIGAFTAYLSHNDTSGPNAFKLKIQGIKKYMKYREFPAELQEEILVYHQHKWKQSQTLDEQAVISILPLPLQLDLSFAVMGEVIKSVPILCECSSIVQKRIAHAMTLQVCPSGSNIYRVGDIGWDIYFVNSGLVKISLPSDLSELDFVGKANVPKARQKADSIGLLYRRGNHFGESCLISESGVRQETVTADTLAELYLLSKDDFEGIWSYMAPLDQEALKRNLLNRNGNAWHSFDDDEDCELISNNQRQTFRNASMIKANSRRRGVFGSFQREQVRLRSFSADASREAIEKRGTDFSSSHNPIDNNQSAALEIQRLVRTGELPVHAEHDIEESSSGLSESSSDTSTTNEEYEEIDKAVSKACRESTTSSAVNRTNSPNIYMYK